MWVACPSKVYSMCGMLHHEHRLKTRNKNINCLVNCPVKLNCSVHILERLKIHFMDKSTGPPTDCRSCSALKLPAGSFCADINARGGLELCSYWISRMLEVFMHCEPQHSVTLFCNLVVCHFVAELLSPARGLSASKIKHVSLLNERK